MAFLTDRSLTTGVTLQDLIHIVNPIDLSQGNPAGSSYKATIQQVSDALLPVFTGTSLYEVGSGTDSTQRVGVGADASGGYSLVGGGTGNTASGNYSFVGGGSCNTIDSITSSGCNVYGSTIGGGSCNTISSYSSYYDLFGNTIAGGTRNTTVSSYFNGQTIGGGFKNVTKCNFSTVGGGLCNTASCYKSTVGGGLGNTASNYYSTVSGGRNNTASGCYSTVNGGTWNLTTDDFSTLVGGSGNTVSGIYSFIGGGFSNKILTLSESSFVGGGMCNTISGCTSTIVGGCENIISNNFSVISGGIFNKISGHTSTIGGGSGNTIGCVISTLGCPVFSSTIGGGTMNTILPITTIRDSYGNTIAGGAFNTTASFQYDAQTIGGGYRNTTEIDYATISGGQNNTISGYFGFVGGGRNNKITDQYASYSTISGGYNNMSECAYTSINGGLNNIISGNCSTIGGGVYNTITEPWGSIMGGSGNTVSHYFSSAVGCGVYSVSACTFHVNYLALQNTPETDVQTTTQYLTRDSSTGVVKTKIIPGPTVFGLYAQTGNSITVSGTTSELSIVGSGVGTLSVPPNGFSVGDSFAVRISGDLGAQIGTDLTLRVKSGSAEFGVVGPINMPNVTSSHFSFEVTFTIRALGTAGNAKIQSSGFFTFTQNAGNTFEGDNFSTLNQTTFDTTISNQLEITAQFDSTNSANFIFTEILVLNKIY